jgi:hypothetical protein
MKRPNTSSTFECFNKKDKQMKNNSINVTSYLICSKIDSFICNYLKEPNVVIINNIDFNNLIDEIESYCNFKFDRESNHGKFFMGIRLIVTEDVKLGELVIL